jgi:hypothetical protein
MVNCGIVVVVSRIGNVNIPSQLGVIIIFSTDIGLTLVVYRI